MRGAGHRPARRLRCGSPRSVGHFSMPLPVGRQSGFRSRSCSSYGRIDAVGQPSVAASASAAAFPTQAPPPASGSPWGRWRRRRDPPIRAARRSGSTISAFARQQPLPRLGGHGAAQHQVAGVVVPGRLEQVDQLRVPAARPPRMGCSGRSSSSTPTPYPRTTSYVVLRTTYMLLGELVLYSFELSHPSVLNRQAGDPKGTGS